MPSRLATAACFYFGRKCLYRHFCNIGFAVIAVLRSHEQLSLTASVEGEGGVEPPLRLFSRLRNRLPPLYLLALPRRASVALLPHINPPREM